MTVYCVFVSFCGFGGCEQSANDRAKAAYQNGDYTAAVQLFTQALADEGESHLIFSNRSAAYCQ